MIAAVLSIACESKLGYNYTLRLGTSPNRIARLLEHLGRSDFRVAAALAAVRGSVRRFSLTTGKGMEGLGLAEVRDRPLASRSTRMISFPEMSEDDSFSIN